MAAVSIIMPKICIFSVALVFPAVVVGWYGVQVAPVLIDGSCCRSREYENATFIVDCDTLKTTITDK